jgi:pyruvate/2-oxoglutarate/acetoin dehydrogenase E1 component
MKYKEALTEAMTMLGKDERTIFLSQSILYPGTGMFETFAGVPDSKKIEMPVAENLQIGIAMGLALAGLIPICCFPRWNFALLAADGIVNHLDKMGMKVIIRVGVGSQKPLDPGPQHVGNYSEPFRQMTNSIIYSSLFSAEIIHTQYQWALKRDKSTILTEFMEHYES